METLGALRRALASGALDGPMARLQYGDPAAARKRVQHVLDRFQQTFNATDDTPAALCSAPGRTEIGGNHTDHQRGRVLAAAVDLDFLGCAAPNGTDTIRFQSEGWPMVEIKMDDILPRPEEQGTTAALVRGMSALAVRDFPVGGYDLYAISDVLPGSGLSSSAACEVLLGVVNNHLFCGDSLSPMEIAQMGRQAENDYFGKPSGLMDQSASSVGGAVAIDFRPDPPLVQSVEVDLAAFGHALCIIDSGADHADLTAEYAAIPREMGAVAAHFGKQFLRDVDEADFRGSLPALRNECGDRAVLRALHFFADDRRAHEETLALARGDFDAFLALVRQSGLSSWTLLQNITPSGAVREQAMAVALAAAEQALGGRGACRVHGGGFAGTIQAFVPLDILEDFRAQVESTLGQGCCHVLTIRSTGGAVLQPD